MARTKKIRRTIQLPKGYLSFSQADLWQKDPERYKQIYFYDRDELRTSNAAMEYGKVVADALERGIDTGDLITDSAMLLLPKYDIADKEIRVTLQSKDGDFVVLGKPDSLDSATKAILEYKTGKNPWTQRKVDDHLQLKMYAMVIWLTYKIVPESVRLVWIETEEYLDEHGKKCIKPTGRVEEFTTTITLADILDTMVLCVRIAKEIEVAYVVAPILDQRMLVY